MRTMNKLNLLAIILTMLSGCGGGDSNNTSPLIGIWITESCEQASDNNGTLQNIWLKGLFEFTNQGKILIGNEIYSDSNCITQTNNTPLTEVIPVTYQDHGSQTLQEGIEGGGLLIETGTGNQILSIDAFYTINNNSLCFSDVFTFEALGFGASEARTIAIDFDNCLTRP